MDISCTNQLKMTGRVTYIASGYYDVYHYVTLTLKTATRFQKINGQYETQTNEHECMLWQRHNKNNLNIIKNGDIISITGELKNQAIYGRYGWTRRMMVFVYDFEVLGHEDDTLLIEESKAETYEYN